MGRELRPGEGTVKGVFRILGRHLTIGGIALDGGGVLVPMKGIAAEGLWKAKWGVTCTEDGHRHSAFLSLRTFCQ